jgi:hypothetical protein
MYDVPDKTPPGPKTVVPPEASGNAYPSPGPSEEPAFPRATSNPTPIARRATTTRLVKGKSTSQTYRSARAGTGQSVIPSSLHVGNTLRF